MRGEACDDGFSVFGLKYHPITCCLCSIVLSLVWLWCGGDFNLSIFRQYFSKYLVGYR